MYSFGPQFDGREGELYKSQAFKAHSSGVVKTLDAAVGMLGPDLEIAAKVLADLGAKHVGYGVLPAHYGIVGEALLHTLETALAESWTPNVKRGWTVIYAFLSTAMLAGSNRQMDKVNRRKARSAKLNGEPAPKLTDTSARGVSIPNEVLTELEGSALTPASYRRLEHLANYLRTGQDGAESVSTRRGDDRTDDLTDTTCSSDGDEDASDVDYSKMVETVSTSWEIVRKIPNCQEVAGVLLFRK
jgi:hemoglobin-like flavoprotein